MGTICLKVMRASVNAALVWCAGALAPGALAAPFTLTYDSFIESKTIGSPLASDSPIRLDGRLRDGDIGAIQNTLSFRAGSSALSLSAGWLTQPASNRTIGVNIDLFDATTNTLVASDAFLGLDGALAKSQMTVSNLTPGAEYRMVFTGTAAEAGRYQIDLVDGASPPPFTALAVASPPADRALFDTHVGTKNFGATFSAGDRLQIDGILRDDALGAIRNDMQIVVGSGTLSGGVTWIVGAGDPRRTIGVNVDLFDAADNLVLSDAFQGVTDGQAFSSFAQIGLAAGTYTLRFTGTAALQGRYRIDLATTALPPEFVPIADEPLTVPEPATWVLLLAGLASVGMLGNARRRRRA